ncbi:MAG: substrate import-associated zinc metallohydrolase lipoprotein [Bacteroidota bacterium]
MKIVRITFLFVFVATVFNSCYPDESLDVPVNDDEIELITELDQYIQRNFTDRYGMSIRYKFIDNYVQPGTRAVPPRLETVRPMLDFIEGFWIDPYLEVDNGRVFFEDHVPSEIILLGGFIFNDDGTVTLGTADAGARITFTNVNAIDPDSIEWRTLQLQTVYHEFAHTVHQQYKLPAAYETISPTGYTSAGSWFNLTDEEALLRGFVSPYSTSSPNEDFAETVAFYLFDPNFFENFTQDEENCETAECEAFNEGRDRIRQKVSAILNHYENVTNVSLEDLRAAVQAKLQ